MTDEEKAAFLAEVRTEVGSTGAPVTARDEVNVPMIRHWCDAMGDDNPVYTDPEVAAASVFGGIVAPPTMLNAWTMAGLKSRRSPDDPQAGAIGKLESKGYLGVVATNSEQVYNRYLRPGDLLTETKKLVDVSEEKHTGLGIGHFVTTETEYHDQHGEHVGSLFFRILKFKPGTGRNRPAGGDQGAPAERPGRPRPAVNMSSEWFWEGCRQRELRIQRCNGCGALQHPPGVRCPACGSMDMGWTVSSGRATLYSWAVPHYPQVPAFDYPLVVGLVELEEGTRLVTNVTDVRPEQLRIGMPLDVHWLEAGDDLVLHQFRPAAPERRVATLRLADVGVGDELPLLPIPLTPTLIVSTAIASRDYQDVHHDRDLANRKGSKDIFMNILTTSGLTGRWLTDWSGPEARFKNLKIRLGAPNYPYDTMTMSGTVTAAGIVDGEAVVTVAFAGLNSLGSHVAGTAELVLPQKGA
jgi:uncharacterized protein